MYSMSSSFTKLLLKAFNGLEQNTSLQVTESAVILTRVRTYLNYHWVCYGNSVAVNT